MIITATSNNRIQRDPAKRRRQWIAFSLVAALLSGGAAVAQIQTQKPSTNYMTIPGYKLSADDGTVEGAVFHHSPGRGTVLIHDSGNKVAFVVDSRQRQVSVFAADDFITVSGGELEPVVGRKAKSVVPMRLVERAPAFTLDGVQYKVIPKPSLTGPQTSAQIIADDPYYGDAAARFEPQAVYLAELEAVETPTRVLLFFGSWCRNCHQWLPNIIKLEQELEGSNVRFEYHGLPQGYADEVAQSLNVRSVPLGVIFQNGEEVTRVAGPSWKFPSLALARALR